VTTTQRKQHKTETEMYHFNGEAVARAANTEIPSGETKIELADIDHWK
jgi:hypothetical protein